MVMVKNGQFWPFDRGKFEFLAMVMVKNFWPFDHDTRTLAKWSKNRGQLTPPPPLIIVVHCHLDLRGNPLVHVNNIIYAMKIGNWVTISWSALPAEHYENCVLFYCSSRFYTQYMECLFNIV